MLDKATLNVIDRDLTLPGLATLLQSSLLAARLTQALGRSVSVQKLSYLRYKPGLSCLAGYELRIDGQVKMVSVRAYHQNSSKYQKALHKLPTSSELGPGGIVLDDIGLIAHGFPHDPELPAIAQLLSTDMFPQTVQKLVPKQPQLHQASITPLRYKPARRLVGRLDHEGLPLALIKIYNDKDFERALTNMRRIQPGRYQLAELLGFSRRRRTVISRWLSGEPLNHLWTQEARAMSSMQRTAAALYDFHQQTSASLNPLKTDDLIKGILMLAQDMAFVLPNLQARVMALAQTLAKHLEELPEVFVPIHGDFSSDQVICDDDTIAIIDLDEVRLGHPAYDLGIFVAQLRREAIFERLPRQTTSTLCNSFVAGYPAWLPETELFAALGLFRLAPHCFRQQIPNWPQKSELLIEAAEQALIGYKKQSRKGVVKG